MSAYELLNVLLFERGKVLIVSNAMYTVEIALSYEQFEKSFVL
jgi:hypothetical protein